MAIWSRVRWVFSGISERARKMTQRVVSSSQEEVIDIVEDIENSDKKGEMLMNYDIEKISRRFWLTWAAVVLLFMFLSKTFSIITLIVAAYIISVAMEWPLRFFMRLFRCKRWFAMTLCYGLLVVLILAVLMVIPFVIVQFGELFSLLVDYGSRTQVLIQEMGWTNFIETRQIIPGYVKNIFLNAMNDPWFVDQLQLWLSWLVGKWQYVLTGISAFALQIATSLVSLLWQASLVLVLSLFFTIEKKWVLDFVVRLLWEDEEKSFYIRKRMLTLYRKLQLWLKWQLFLMLYVWGFAWLGMMLMWLFWLPIDKVWLLALMAWVTELIPYVWPLLWWLPVLLVATLSHGLTGAIVVIVLFAVIQWTENNIVVPVVMNKVLWVSPLVIFICMLLWWWVLGFVWVLLAVPISVIVTVIADKTFE